MDSPFVFSQADREGGRGAIHKSPKLSPIEPAASSEYTRGRIRRAADTSFRGTQKFVTHFIQRSPAKALTLAAIFGLVLGAAAVLSTQKSKRFLAPSRDRI